MNKYRQPKLIKAGFIGVVLLILVTAVGLQPERLVQMATALRYEARFTEAGGINTGDDVTVSGIKVGSVTAVALQRGEVAIGFTVKSTVQLGAQTTAHIRTSSVLGRRVLTLESAGGQILKPGEVIPVSRTSSPYSLTEALGDLTTNTAATDTASLNQSLDTLSGLINQISPQLGPTFDGLSRLSQTFNSRNESLTALLKNTAEVSGILSERSQQLNTLLLDANDLFAVLAERRQVIVELLANISALSQQLSGMVHDNERELVPTLEKLNSVTAMLQKNSDNIAKTLPGVAKTAITSGETVSSGAYYQGFAMNLLPGQYLQPFLDYYFGFRRGTDAGQPPDNAGPRAEFPFPHNEIPQQPGDHP